LQSNSLEKPPGTQNYFGSDDDDLAFADLDTDYCYVPAEGVEGGPIDFHEGLGGQGILLPDSTIQSPPNKPIASKAGTLRRTISTREMIEKAMEENAAAEAKKAQIGDAAKMSSGSKDETHRSPTTAAKLIQQPQHVVLRAPDPKPEESSSKTSDPRPVSSSGAKPLKAVGSFHFPDSASVPVNQSHAPNALAIAGGALKRSSDGTSRYPIANGQLGVTNRRALDVESVGGDAKREGQRVDIRLAYDHLERMVWVVYF